MTTRPRLLLLSTVRLSLNVLPLTSTTSAELLFITPFFATVFDVVQAAGPVVSPTLTAAADPRLSTSRFFPIWDAQIVFVPPCGELVRPITDSVPPIVAPVWVSAAPDVSTRFLPMLTLVMDSVLPDSALRLPEMTTPLVSVQVAPFGTSTLPYVPGGRLPLHLVVLSGEAASALLAAPAIVEPARMEIMSPVTRTRFISLLLSLVLLGCGGADASVPPFLSITRVRCSSVARR